MSITAGAAALMGGAALASGALSAFSSERAIKKQIEWEKERATHAHQWEVKDLKAAGLNPILSAGGQGATTGGISAPVPDFSAIPNAANTIVTAGLEKERINNETSTTSALVEKTNAERINIMQDTLNKMREEGLIDAKKQREYAETMLKTGETELVYNQLKREQATIEQEIETLKVQLKTAKTKAEKEQIQDRIDKKTAWLDKIVGYVGQAIGMGTKTGTTAAALKTAHSLGQNRHY